MSPPAFFSSGTATTFLGATSTSMHAASAALSSSLVIGADQQTLPAVARNSRTSDGSVPEEEAVLVETAGGVSGWGMEDNEDVVAENLNNSEATDDAVSSPLASAISADLVQSPELFQVRTGGNMHTTTRQRFPFVAGGALRPRRNPANTAVANAAGVSSSATASTNAVFRCMEERPIVRAAVYTSLAVGVIVLLSTVFSEALSSVFGGILLLFGGSGNTATGQTVATSSMEASVSGSAVPTKKSSSTKTTTSSSTPSSPQVVAAEVPTPISLVNTIAPVPIQEAIEGTSDTTLMSAGVSFLVLTAARLGLRQ